MGVGAPANGSARRVGPGDGSPGAPGLHLFAGLPLPGAAGATAKPEAGGGPSPGLCGGGGLVARPAPVPTAGAASVRPSGGGERRGIPRHKLLCTYRL